MTSTGIVRSVDHLGRIVLPKDLRQTMGLVPETPMEIFTEGETIILRKYRPAGGCVFCGEANGNCVELRGKWVCPACRAALNQM